MMMSMNLVPSLQLRLERPCCKSVFPAVDKLLDDTDYQRALDYVAGKKNMKRYTCIVDFLFSELMGGKWRAACFRFYEGKGCMLKDDPRVTPKMLADWEEQICFALQCAWEDMDEERTRSWSDFHRRWLQRLAA